MYLYKLNDYKMSSEKRCHNCKDVKIESIRYFGEKSIYSFCSKTCFRQSNLKAYDKSKIRIVEMGRCMKRLKFSNKMRKLWNDHTLWTRNYIISAAHDLPDINDVLDRLLQNQDDIGMLFGKFYGKQIGLEIANVLKEHIQGAGNIIDSVKKGNTNETPGFLESWYENAQMIADYLYNLNTEHWDNEILREAMNKHLDDTLSEATHRLNKEYYLDIHDYEYIVNHINVMADIFSQGIIDQFPDSFK